MVRASYQPKLSLGITIGGHVQARESCGLLCKAARARCKVGHVCADVRHALLRNLLIAEGFSSATSLLFTTTCNPGSLSTFRSAAWLQCFGSWLGSTLFSSNLGFCSMAAKNLLSLGVPKALDDPVGRVSAA